jgi:hypothetical protein
MNENDYEAPKKWLKYKPSDLPTKPEEPEKTKGSTPKTVNPPIPLELIETLRARAQLPRKKDNYGRNDELWDNVLNLKGWLSKPASDYSMAGVHWERIKKMLDAAVTEHDPIIFGQFSDAWNAKSEKKLTDQVKKRSKNNTVSDKVLKCIEGLIPAPRSTTPGKPTLLWIINIIEDLQRKLRRAPTQKEIIVALADKGFELPEGDLSEQLCEMGLGDSLSRW